MGNKGTKKGLVRHCVPEGATIRHKTTFISFKKQHFCDPRTTSPLSSLYLGTNYKSPHHRCQIIFPLAPDNGFGTASSRGACNSKFLATSWEGKNAPRGGTTFWCNNSCHSMCFIQAWCIADLVDVLAPRRSVSSRFNNPNVNDLACAHALLSSWSLVAVSG